MQWAFLLDRFVISFRFQEENYKGFAKLCFIRETRSNLYSNKLQKYADSIGTE